MCYGCKRDFGPEGELVYEAEQLILHEVRFHGSRYRFCTLACVNLAEANRDLDPRVLERPGQRQQWRGRR